MIDVSKNNYGRISLNQGHFTSPCMVLMDKNTFYFQLKQVCTAFNLMEWRWHSNSELQSLFGGRSLLYKPNRY